MSSSRGDWPIFGRDAPDVAWRPDPGSVGDARLARFLRATAERSLDALQARATADAAWFWGAATDDIAIPWTRRPRQVADFGGGPAWTRWWIGGAFDWSWAAVEPREGQPVERPAARDVAARRVAMQPSPASDRMKRSSFLPALGAGIDPSRRSAH